MAEPAGHIPFLSVPTDPIHIAYFVGTNVKDRTTRRLPEV